MTYIGGQILNQNDLYLMTEGVVTGDRQIDDLFHVAQEHVRRACESNSIK